MNRGTKITMITLGLATTFMLNCQAQQVTYTHDASKMNQITVMEIGAGTLTPELYYWMFHNNYKKSAAQKNKLGYRTAAGISAYKQVDMSKQMDSAMVKRGEIELLNIADRKGGALDVAWMAEGSKITDKLETFHRNIERIMVTGGSRDCKERWTYIYNMCKSAVKATQDAYMPNAKRKKQYLQIYADICRQNETLVKYIAQLSRAKTTSQLLAATYQRPNRTAAIVATSLNRWREAGWATAGKTQNE